MAKDIKIKFTIDGIEKEVDNLKDFNKDSEILFNWNSCHWDIG